MNAAPESRDEIRRRRDAQPGPSVDARSAANAREATLTKPPGALGRLEEISAWLSAWQGRHPPSVGNPHVVVFAGNHGVAARGISAYSTEVTAQMVANFEAGGAAVNQLTYAIDNLSSVKVNAEASRSRILDTDYATQTSELAQTQIIQQAGTAMLAQANQLPQTVLSLLQ